MPPKPSALEQRELAYLAERSRAILDFVASRSGEEFAASARMLREVIRQTADRGDLRGLRSVRRDLLDMSRALAAEDQRALAELLRAQALSDPYPADGAI